MKRTFTFERTPVSLPQCHIDTNAISRSIDAFTNKKYIDSFLFLLDHINLEIRILYGNTDGTTFNIPHGQIIVKISIDNDFIEITAPFVSLPSQNRTSLLYHVASINANEMNLAAIVLEENTLYFRYRCPISLAEPYKIFNILKEICVISDKYHHVFTSQFKAKNIFTPENIHYKAETINNIYRQIQLCCDECLSAVSELEKEKEYGQIWNIIAITMYKLVYISQPQGALLDYLRHSISENYRKDISILELIENGKKVIENIKNTSKEKLSASLYYSATFISAKPIADYDRIRKNFSNIYNKATQSILAGDHMECYLLITYKFYETYYYCNVPKDIDKLIITALETSSAKPFNKAALILYGAMKDIIMLNHLQQEADNIINTALQRLPENNHVDTSVLNRVSSFCKKTLDDMNISCEIASIGEHAWQYEQDEHVVHLFIFEHSYLFCSTEICKLPQQNQESVLTYLLSTDIAPYRLGIEGDQIYMAYRIAISDIVSGYGTDIEKNIVNITYAAKKIKNKLYS